MFMAASATSFMAVPAVAPAAHPQRAALDARRPRGRRHRAMRKRGGAYGIKTVYGAVPPRRAAALRRRTPGIWRGALVFTLDARHPPGARGRGQGQKPGVGRSVFTPSTPRAAQILQPPVADLRRQLSVYHAPAPPAMRQPYTLARDSYSFVRWRGGQKTAPRLGGGHTKWVWRAAKARGRGL